VAKPEYVHMRSTFPPSSGWFRGLRLRSSESLEMHEQNDPAERIQDTSIDGADSARLERVTNDAFPVLVELTSAGTNVKHTYNFFFSCVEHTCVDHTCMREILCSEDVRMFVYVCGRFRFVCVYAIYAVQASMPVTQTHTRACCA
jgi:hypothetical protein